MTLFVHVPTPREVANVHVSFKNGGHLYHTPDGDFVGITSQLGALPRFKNPIEKWQKRIGFEAAKLIGQQAIKRGTDFHNLIEAYLSNRITTNVGAGLLGTALFERIKPELEQINFIQAIEKPLWNKELGIAGKVDTIANYSNTLSIIDYKSSLKPKKREYIQNYFLQACAYQQMYLSLTGVSIENLVIIVADEQGGVNTFVEKSSNLISELKECLAEYREMSLGGVAN